MHELMWMAHDMGATPEERAQRGEWPEDTDGRLAKYTAICDRIYFSDTEMLLFSSMMYDKRGISLVFRTWRCTGKGQGQGELISTTPDPAVLEMNRHHQHDHGRHGARGHCRWVQRALQAPRFGQPCGSAGGVPAGQAPSLDQNQRACGCGGCHLRAGAQPWQVVRRTSRVCNFWDTFGAHGWNLQ